MSIKRAIRVLYITTMYPIPAFPQQGIFCHEQVKALKQIGVDVTVAVPIPFYDSQKEKKWDYEGIHIRYVRFFKMPRARDFHRTGRSLFQALNKAFKLNAFDLFHADASLPSGYAAMIASEKYHIPFLVHGHGLDVFLEGSYSGLKNCNKISEACQLVYKRANAVVGVSQKVLNNIQEKVDISGKAYVVYNGVDVDKFLPMSHKNEQLIITSIGNLIPLKGHDYTIKAVKRLVDQGYTNIKLIIAGRGKLEKELKQSSHSLGLDNYIEFVGYIPYNDIVKLLQNSDIFVLPSWYEALGCVYLEAMACGVPAIGCWDNGIDEVITDGVNGYLVEGKSDEQIVDKLKQFIENNGSAMMGEKARLTVEEKFKWEDSAYRLKRIYGDLI